MATATFDGQTVDVNDEGYLTDHTQWNPDLAREMAREMDIELTDKHFEVLNFLRKRYINDESLTIRRVGKSGIVSIKEFYDLFPGGPLKVSSKLAGIPKPSSCI
jgi:tRNA 2-thiouridine synthesizing protein E